MHVKFNGKELKTQHFIERIKTPDNWRLDQRSLQSICLLLFPTMFEKAKNLFKLQQEARHVKKELNHIHIEADVDGVIVVVNAEQEVISVTIPEGAHVNQKKLEENLVKAFNKALKKSQQIAAEKMKGVMGGLGFPGMS